MAAKKKICKRCNFWQRHSGWAEKSRGKDNGECHCPKFIYVGDGTMINSDELGYWDADSYQAGIYTGENFGCIHFQDGEK